MDLTVALHKVGTEAGSDIWPCLDSHISDVEPDRPLPAPKLPIGNAPHIIRSGGLNCYMKPDMLITGVGNKSCSGQGTVDPGGTIGGRFTSASSMATKAVTFGGRNRAAG